MKKIFIVANWKSNKTILQTEEWITAIQNSEFRIQNEGKEIIVCPSFIHFSLMKLFIEEKKLSVKLGSQNISPFEEGAYTGEVSAKQIKEFVEYVIIGHSERRKNFFENEEIVNMKIGQAFKHKLIPIVCVSSLEQSRALQDAIKNSPQFVVAYEPLFAIGSDTADTPENADQMAKSIKNILGEISVLYGGSVTSNNISEFSKKPNIDGALVGKASLDPLEFLGIVKNA